MIRWCLHATPCGVLRLGAFGGRLCLCDWADVPARDFVVRRLERGLHVRFAPWPDDGSLSGSGPRGISDTPDPDGSDNPDYRPTSFRTDTLQLGERSSWSWTPHTYGLAITETDTVYYFDNIEVLRHPTNDISKKKPLFFLINYAIGGISGWPIDLERFGNASDMYVDYVRVFAEKKIEYSIPLPDKK